MLKVKVAIIGATGYTGAELVRLLSFHSDVEIVAATSTRQAGQPLRASCPWLNTDLILSSFEPETLACDIAFFCQEAGFAGEVAPILVKRGIKVIDLSADYRLTDPATYEKYYGRPHPAPQPDYKVAYGLPEITKHELIERAAVVANPGCYPTASLLALMPVISAGWLTGTPIIDAKSGVSGAGRSKADTAYLFSELNGGFKAYAGVGHRHSPEIAQLAGRPVRFTPHLIPAARGIHSTLHLPILPTVTDAHVEELFYEFYRFSPCVQWVQDWPSTKQVLGSNRCDIFGKVDQESGFLVLASVIDNLVKGASGQAIQNMNIICGFDEAAGLPLDGVWP